MQGERLIGLDDEANGCSGKSSVDGAADYELGRGIAGGGQDVAATLLKAKVTRKRNEVSDAGGKTSNRDGTVRSCDGAGRQAQDLADCTDGQGLTNGGSGRVKIHTNTGGARRSEGCGQCQHRGARGAEGDPADRWKKQAKGGTVHTNTGGRRVQKSTGIIGNDLEVARTLLKAEITGE